MDNWSLGYSLFLRTGTNVCFVSSLSCSFEGKNYFKASSKTIIKSFSLTPLFSDSSHDTCLEVISSRITVHYIAQSLYIHTTYVSPKDDVTIKPFPIVLYSFSLTVFTAAFILSSTHGLPNQTMTSNLFAFLLRFRGK